MIVNFIIIRMFKLIVVFKLGVTYVTGTRSLVNKLLDIVGSFDIWRVEGITSGLCSFD